MMTSLTDVRLSPSKICEIAGVSAQRRQSLIARGLLPKEPVRGCSIVDALLLAGITAVSERLSPSETAVAWPTVQTVLESSVPGQRFDVVFDAELGTVTIVRDDDALREAVGHGRPVRVLVLGPRLQEVSDAFRRWAAGAAAGRRRSAEPASRRKTS